VKQLEHVPLCVSGLVMTTFTDPAACAIVVPAIVVALIVETVRAEPPNDTVAPVANPVPAIVTEVPPADAPVFGVTDATVGAGATYVKQPAQVPLCVSVFVTTTFTAPAACAVVTPVIVVALTVETVSADPPNETVAPVWNPVPATVTDVPPAVGPLVGATDVTVGATTYAKHELHVPLCVSELVTTTFTAPASCDVVVPVIVVALIVETVRAEPPKDTVAPLRKPLPVMVTEVPPAAGPLVGATELTVGAGARYVKQPKHAAL